jgi:hypothetical protein
VPADLDRDVRASEEERALVEGVRDRYREDEREEHEPDQDLRTAIESGSSSFVTQAV